MKYFVISHDEDGDWGVRTYDSIDVIASRFDLNAPVDEYVDGGHPMQQFKETLDDSTSGVMLIRGEVMIPKIKEVIKKWSFE